MRVITRLELENLIRGYAQAIDGSLVDLLEQEYPGTLGSKVGYALVLFDFGDAGSMAYASNADRSDMVRTLRELISKLETH
jgi:hypothetical protein